MSGPARPLRVAGVMSGTSCDGVDAVLAAIDPGAFAGPASGAGGGGGAAPRGGVAVLGHHHAPYDAALQRRLLGLPRADVAEVARLHVELGRRFAEAVAALLAAAGVAAREVELVALAGHTAAHLPPSEDDAGATLALGDGDVVAELTGCPVLCEPRARDRAAGGAGAPLVPFADALLLGGGPVARAALNLGGIANVTLLRPGGEPLAFDTGPGNMLLDGALRRASGGELSFDEGGALGLAGRVEEGWLARALAADDFLVRPPPRSTGRERYGEAFLERHWDVLGELPLPALAATLAAYTVEAVAVSLERFAPVRPAELVVSGGGARNRCLLAGLQRRLPGIDVRTSEEALGIDAGAREALAFALLGAATVCGVPGNVPGVTGARHPVLLGKLCAGAGGRWPTLRGR